MKFNIFKSRKNKLSFLEKFLNDRTPSQVYDSSITINTLIEYLNKYDKDCKIIFQNSDKKFIDVILLRKIIFNKSTGFKDCVNIILK